MYFLNCYGLTLCSPLLVSGCAQEYLYSPAVRDSDFNDSAVQEAVYAFPPDTPAGNVRVKSLGINPFRPLNTKNQTPALHLRMTMFSQGPNPWTLTVKDQEVTFPETQNDPIPADPGSEALSKISVSPGDIKTVDLFFTLAPADSKEMEIPNFDFHWRLHTAPLLTFSETTTFIRQPEYVGSSTGPDIPPLPYH